MAFEIVFMGTSEFAKELLEHIHSNQNFNIKGVYTELLNKKDYIDIIQQYELPLLPVESKSGGLHLFLFLDNFTDSKTVKSFYKIIDLLI